MKKLFTIIALLFPVYLTAQLKINEIMPNNVSAVMDDTYNYSMWAEIYNSGTSAINIVNYYFSDDATNLKKWRQPASITINAKGYCILWFERNDLSSLHCNFKLLPEGGALYFSNASGVLVDSINYPAQFRNVSYGRKTDGTDQWVFFENCSPGSSNDNKKSASVACEKPVFKLAGGFYSSSQTTGINDPLPGDTIYYTTNGSEPIRSSLRYTAGQSIPLNATSILRARTFSQNKLPSDISTVTYFIKERNFGLPVVSIVTEPKNLFDNTIGIYTVGTNGISGNGSDSPTNCNQMWDRPANFELYDTSGNTCLNQELDICLSGGWSRNMNPQKSLQINPTKKYGDNKLNYDIFSAKPGHKYRSIQFRNSGNDFFYSMMRDGFMHTLVANRMNMDYAAYQPAVCFMNGVYYGIQNLQERSNADYVYSNYGLSKEEISLLDPVQMPSDPVFSQLTNYVKNNDVTKSDVYDQVGNMMDIDNFMSYFISEIYWNNTDWPHNNMKVWKKLDGGIWRWILYDTDFGFDLYDDNGHYNNTLTYTFNHTDVPSCVILNRLLLNQTFRNKFIDRFCIQLSSTFETQRVNHVMDSIANMISKEIVYHKAKWGSYSDFNRELTRMKTFSSLRPDIMLGFIGSYFLNSAPVRTIDISSNIDNASYIFNTENIIDNKITLKSFMNRAITLEPNSIKGYKFNHWEIQNSNNETVIPMNSVWKYWDKNGIPAANWNTSGYNDASWNSGPAQLGYGDKEGREATVLGYGPDPNNKYPTAYFRKAFTVTDLANKNNFEFTVFVDDGAAAYINGTEIGRYNLPAGTLTFNTYTLTWNDGEYATFSVPKSLLKEGDNLIAVEVHQTSGTSSDLIFNASLTYSGTEVSQTSNNPVFTTTLTDNISIKAVFDEDNSNIDPNENAKVFINEIIASNNTYKDEYGNKSDYIELYNAGNEDTNIAGWYLSDKESNPTLCQIPTTDSTKTNIPAKGRINVWFDKQPQLGVLHVSKGLSKTGEAVVLSRPDIWEGIKLVDKVTFPALEKNQSYSRVPDGSDNWVIQAPTFNLPNSNVESISKVEAAFKVYPIAVNDYIIVEQALNKQVRICDLNGKALINTVCRSEKETIRLNNLQKGIYIVIVENSASKIIKQ